MDQITEKLAHVLEEVSPVIYYKNGFFRLSSVVVVTWVSMIILFALAFILTRNLKLLNPSKKQIIAEKIVILFKNFVTDLCGNKGNDFFGVIGSIFLIIIFMNFIWFIPNLKSPTASYSSTFAVAFVGFLYSQYLIIKYRGIFYYFKNYFEPLPFMVFFNIMDLFTRPFALSVRLFGNVFTGEVMLAVMYSILPIFLPLPFYFLEILAGSIQAYVLCTLVCVYASESLE